MGAAWENAGRGNNAHVGCVRCGVSSARGARWRRRSRAARLLLCPRCARDGAAIAFSSSSQSSSPHPPLALYAIQRFLLRLCGSPHAPHPQCWPEHAAWREPWLVRTAEVRAARFRQFIELSIIRSRNGGDDFGLSSRAKGRECSRAGSTPPCLGLDAAQRTRAGPIGAPSPYTARRLFKNALLWRDGTRSRFRCLQRLQRPWVAA